MKRLFAFVVAAALTASAAMASSRTIAPADLPRAAQLVIEKNYGRNAVHHAKVDKGTFGVKGYEVILKNGTEIEFDQAGAITEIYSGNKGVPQALVPQPITDYVKRYYPKTKIVELEIDRKGYDIKLSSGVELEFDRSGNFVRVDR